jgi:hypothetical protein
MKYLEKHPNLREQFDSLGENRRNEILSQLLESDSEYVKLRDERANASSVLRESLSETQAELFEKYSDSLYAQDVYELDAVYRQAIYDTLRILSENGLI